MFCLFYLPSSVTFYSLVIHLEHTHLNSILYTSTSTKHALISTTTTTRSPLFPFSLFFDCSISLQHTPLIQHSLDLLILSLSPHTSNAFFALPLPLPFHIFIQLLTASLTHMYTLRLLHHWIIILTLRVLSLSSLVIYYN